MCSFKRVGTLKFKYFGSCTVALLAIWGAAAHAQSAPKGSSSVELYGLIGVYVDQSKLSSTPHGMIQEGGGGLTTSFRGPRGREDLGGGNSVIFVLESFFRPNTGQMGRNSTDGLFSLNAYSGYRPPTAHLSLASKQPKRTSIK